ncbi:hypothetical protein HDE_05596 [Halotydeus destructor]|nr:hypothetical protein HDE_05596 [Halotydeus destructor]
MLRLPETILIRPSRSREFKSRPMKNRLLFGPVHIIYPVSESVTTSEADQDDGMDNPFRPGSRLSQEADEIVRLIIAGKPLTPVTSPTTHQDLLLTDNTLDTIDGDGDLVKTHRNGVEQRVESPRKTVSPVTASPPEPYVVNGTRKLVNSSQTKNGASAAAATVAVNGNCDTDVPKQLNSTDITASMPVDKKPKGKCCVIQ